LADRMESSRFQIMLNRHRALHWWLKPPHWWRRCQARWGRTLMATLRTWVVVLRPMFGAIAGAQRSRTCDNRCIGEGGARPSTSAYRGMSAGAPDEQQDVEGTRSVRMNADQYLFSILQREQVDTGPNSPAPALSNFGASKRHWSSLRSILNLR
jgi:hypothetical protein